MPSFPRPTLLNKFGTIRRLPEWLRAALLFAAVVVAAFPQVIFLGRSLVLSDNYNTLDFRYTTANYGPDYVPSDEWAKSAMEFCTNFHDPGGGWWQAEPAQHFFRNAIFSGQFPFWDPHTGCGAPAYANPTSEFLFPPQIILSLAGATSLQKNIYILLLFWMSGYATYWLLRLHALSAMASFVGGVAFLLSGAMQQVGPAIFTGQVVACMPLLLLATKWFINLPSWRRTAGLALVYATVSLASFPPLLVAAFTFALCYFVCAALIDARDKWLLVMGRYVAAVALSVLCVAVYFLPMFFVIRYTDYTREWYRSAGLEVMPWRAIFELFSPVIAATEARVYVNPLLKLSVLGHFYYVGVTVVVLALMAGGRGAVGRSRSLVVGCVSALVLVLLKMFGVPPVHWIGYLPVFQNIHYTLYFGTLIALALCLLAAIGFQRLQERNGSPFMFALTACFMIAAFLVLWHKASKTGGLGKEGAWRWIADYRLLLAFFGAAAGLTLAAMARRTVLNAVFARWSLIALIVGEGIINTTYPRQNRWDVYAHPPEYVSVLEKLQKPARVFIANALTANLGSAFGIDELDSLYMFSAPRMYSLYQKYAKSASVITMRDATAIPPDPVLSRAGISHLLIRYDIAHLNTAAEARAFPVEYDDGYVRLYRCAAAPRYLFSSEYVVTDAFKALELIGDSAPKEVMLETPPGFESFPNRDDDPEPEIVSAKLNSITLRLNAPRAGLLYLAEAWYPGWSATVNGKPASILNANYGFRAVTVPAGEVLVHLRYWPVGFVTGGILSTIGLAGAVALLLFGGRSLQKSFWSKRDADEGIQDIALAT